MSTTIEKLKASHKKHPLKFFFKKHSITQVELSNYLGVGHHSLTMYLNGYRPVPAHLEKKLWSLAKHIKAEAG